MSVQIPVLEKILSANDQLATTIRQQFDVAQVVALNVMASPGAGKTSLIERTIHALKAQYRLGIIEGDIATSIDAERAQAAGATAIQINTGGNCHLEAAMLLKAIQQLPLNDLDLLIVENVGNLICPSNWYLGTHYNVVVASVPEGDDKPYKYPGMYYGADVVVLNKIDLLPYINFRMEYFMAGVRGLNPALKVFPLSCTTGEGMTAWLDWVRNLLSNT